ncbi:MAG: hypothetical protein RI953_623 [Pseudomonadota bacterium]
MKSWLLLLFLASPFGVSGCLGAAPGVSSQRLLQGTSRGASDASVNTASGENSNTVGTVQQGSPDNSAQNNAGMVGAPAMNSSAGSGMGGSGAGSGAALLMAWMPMGDMPAANLGAITECTNSENILRSACTTENARCKSSFAVTCDSSTDCRRLFKCTTGQTGTLIWFPMGNDIPKSDTLSKICTIDTNIAGSACNTVNDRCLSSFCTSGSGDGCGRRLFKCLTAGEPGKYFWRWVEDKQSAELDAFGFCPVDSNIAGTQCATANSRCKSSFCAEGTAPDCTKRRLFKCTP